MGGVDHADQFRSHYSVCRTSHKWYRYLLWHVFKVLLNNTFILPKKNIQQQRRYTVRDFCLVFAKQLIGGFSSRSDNNMKHSLRANATVPVNADNAADHFCAKRQHKERKRPCVQCKKDGRKTGSNKPKEIVLRVCPVCCYFV